MDRKGKGGRRRSVSSTSCLGVVLEHDIGDDVDIVVDEGETFGRPSIHQDADRDEHRLARGKHVGESSRRRSGIEGVVLSQKGSMWSQGFDPSGRRERFSARLKGLDGGARARLASVGVAASVTSNRASSERRTSANSRYSKVGRFTDPTKRWPSVRDGCLRRHYGDLAGEHSRSMDPWAKSGVADRPS